MPLELPTLNPTLTTTLRRIYAGVDGYVLSGEAKRAAKLQDEALTYGELPPAELGRIFERCRPKAGEHFADLGSGVGRVVITAQLLFPEFASARGIELLPSLTGAAEAARQLLAKEYPEQASRIQFTTGDVTALAWEDADIALVHATCFDEGLMRRLGEKAGRLKPGSRFVALGQPVLELPGFLEEIFTYRTAWHRAGTGYLYTRP